MNVAKTRNPGARKRYGVMRRRLPGPKNRSSERGRGALTSPAPSNEEVLASLKEAINRCCSLIERLLRRRLALEGQRDSGSNRIVDLRPCRTWSPGFSGLQLLLKYAEVGRKVRAAGELAEYGHLTDAAHRELRLLGQHETHELHRLCLVLALLEKDYVLSTDHRRGAALAGRNDGHVDCLVRVLTLEDRDHPGTIQHVAIKVLCVPDVSVRIASQDAGARLLRLVELGEPLQRGNAVGSVQVTGGFGDVGIIHVAA